MATAFANTRELIRVLVADASRMSCQLLADALQRSDPRFDVMACTMAATDVLKAITEQQPDIALLSANLPDGATTGFKVLREMRAAHLKTRAILLVDSSEREAIIEAFRCGAKGVFCRAGAFEALRKCIESVHRGQIWANSNELQFLLEALAQRAPQRLVNATGTPLLTRREEDVVHLVTEGLTNREIAVELHLSEHTVKNYLCRIFEKLGISKRVELVLFAMR